MIYYKNISRDSMYRVSSSSVKKWLKFILFLALGIVFNLLLNRFANRFLGKMLYLDAAGTMVVAVIGGYFPGIFVALLTNFLAFIVEPPAVYYVILNIVVAFSITYFYKHYKDKGGKPGIYFTAFILSIALECSLIGCIMTYAQGCNSANGYGMIDNFITIVMSYTHINFYMAYILCNFIVHIVDKSICIIICLFILKIIPEKLKKELHDVGWYQKPLNDDQIKNIEVRSARKMSVKTKVVVAITTACLAITFVVALMSRLLFISYMEDKCGQEAKGASKLVAATIDSYRINHYIKYGEAAGGYESEKELLHSVSSASTTVESIFVYAYTQKGLVVVFDFNTKNMEGLDAGTIIEYDERISPYISRLDRGEDIEPFLHTEQNGRKCLTSLSPVFDNEGKCVCYAGVDVSLEDVRTYENQFMIRLFSLCSGFMIMIIAASIWLSKYHIIYPVNALVKAARDFDYKDEESRKQNVESVREIGIHTGDEIENLYYAFLQTIEENMINYSYMLRKSKDLDEVQSGLIMVLADLVENRDSSTGDHIRKTATYTGIVMRKMRNMGYYTEILTDDFIETVIKAAPLHDIGKIRVPDAILNKPGKLTDEEYSIMKKHTIYGAKVIDQCIESLPNANFLVEAKNVAALHHEKWDGTGYPFGLKGEEIPLSARVMAVADVFDALVSKRVYKVAYTFDEAMNIINKDSGTHFDPKVAEAFILAEKEVRAAAEYFEHKHMMNDNILDN